MPAAAAHRRSRGSGAAAATAADAAPEASSTMEVLQRVLRAPPTGVVRVAAAASLLFIVAVALMTGASVSHRGCRSEARGRAPACLANL